MLHNSNNSKYFLYYGEELRYIDYLLANYCSQFSILSTKHRKEDATCLYREIQLLKNVYPFHFSANHAKSDGRSGVANQIGNGKLGLNYLNAM